MKVVFLGPPGAGKGTQAQRLAQKLKVPRIATGDMLRSHVEAGTDLGKAARDYMARGELVPDDLIVAMIRARLAEPDCADGFVLDGFPRTRDQAVALEALTDLDLALLLAVDEEEIVTRLTGRRVCRKCQAVYHREYDPPRERGVCDRCGGELYQRADDREEVIRERLRTYRERTEALVDRYRDGSLLVEVDGEGSIETVARRVREAVEERRAA